MDAYSLATDYMNLGYDAIPLLAGTKEAACKGWQNAAPITQWANAPKDANIGIRGGGPLRLGILDCDNPETWDMARRWAAGLGYMPDGDYPLVQTASGTGRHIYLHLTEPITGAWKRLRSGFGKGELRFGSGAYVVAPGSVVNGREYKILAGDLRQLPRLERADLCDLVDLDSEPALSLGLKPDRNPSIPRLARELLEGRGGEGYRSRSEAEAALITALINAGHDFGSVVAIFQTSPCTGKYAELRQEKGDKEALRWLRRTYDTQAAWAEAHETEGRKLARLALEWAYSRPWPGRTGNSDRVLFRAHAVIAYQSGKELYHASVRDLAEKAGVALKTADVGNRRLIAAGLVCRVTSVNTNAAATYRLKVGADGQTYYTPPRGGPTCGGVSQVCPLHDAFRFLGLRNFAEHVWAILASQPGLTVAELAEQTGKCPKTVQRALAKMSRMIDPDTGEILRMVEPDGAGWRALAVDLEAVAQAVGTAGATERQRKLHDEQRRGHARFLARAREGSIPERTGK